MHRYCVNKNAQSNGDHEVHDVTANCKYLPNQINRINLGDFNSCHGAVTEAKKRGYRANGCYYCCRPCHTG